MHTHTDIHNINSVNKVTVSTLSPSCGIITAFVNIYLVDGVSGGVVYHTTHKQASGPVHLVHSENWIVVSHHLMDSSCQQRASLLVCIYRY